MHVVKIVTTYLKKKNSDGLEITNRNIKRYCGKKNKKQKKKTLLIRWETDS